MPNGKRCIGVNKMTDVILVVYLLFVVGYAYFCYGKYNWLYWMHKFNMLPILAQTTDNVRTFLY